MKQNTLVRKMIYKYIYLFLLSTLFLFVLSELIVQGSDFISNAINLMLEGETVDVVSLITKTERMQKYNYGITREGTVLFF